MSDNARAQLLNYSKSKEFKDLFS